MDFAKPIASAKVSKCGLMLLTNFLITGVLLDIKLDSNKFQIYKFKYIINVLIFFYLDCVLIF